MTGKRSMPFSRGNATPVVEVSKRNEMPSSKGFMPKRKRKDQVVRTTLSDGTPVEYRYPRGRSATRTVDPDSFQGFVIAYRRSPEFEGLRPNSRRQYNLHLDRLSDIWDQPISELDRGFWLDTRDGMVKRYGPAAANCFVQAVSAVYAWAVERRKLPHNPLARVKRLKGGSFPAWTRAQIDVALNRFPEPLCRALILGMHTGQRRSDLITMTWSNYDGTTIKVRQIKTGEDVVIPVHRELKAALERWRTKTLGGANVIPHPSAPILTNASGRPWTDLSRSFAAAVQEAGLPPSLNVHGLRKFFCTNVAEVGESVYAIQALSGHRDIRALEPYVREVNKLTLADRAIRALERQGR